MPFEQHPDQVLQLAWYAQRKPVFTGGNRVDLLRGALELFPAQVQAIDAAQRSVWMATYLVSDQGASVQVMAALQRAARRGVAVHLVVDGVGSHEVPAAAWQALQDSGVHFAVYRPVGRMWRVALDPAHWRRMHIKLCVVDEAVAFTGGINLIDDHFDLHLGWARTPRLDYAVRFEGPTVAPALHTVRAMWARATLGRDWRDDLVEWAREPGRMKRLRQRVQGHLQETRLRLSPTEQGVLSHAAHQPQPMRAAFVLRDNLRQRRTIERAAQQAIGQARSQVDIVTPYFYPGRVLRRALRLAAARGVRVRLLLQGKPDYRLAALAAQVLYAELQQHGVRIFEYQAAWLHAKVLCVDGEWATIGSSNLDPLSLLLNLEANLIVRDRGFARQVAEALRADFAHSREVPLPPLAQPSLMARLKRVLVAWSAKAYLRLAGIVRRF